MATGGKSGGIQGQQLGQNFNPEKDTDFEIGWKGSHLDGHATVQLNGFYTRYTQMQIADTDIATGSSSIYNAGSTSIYGLEFAWQALIADWRLNATAAYTRSSFSVGNIVNKDICGLDPNCNNSKGQCPPGVSGGTNGCFDYVNGDGGGATVNGKFYPWLESVSDLQLPNSPKFQFNVAVGYDFHVGNGDVLTPRIDYSYQGTQYSQIYDTPFDNLPSRTNVNFKLSYLHGPWYTEAYMTNVTNAVYPVAQNDTLAQIYDAPRQWGVRVTRKF